MKQEIQRLLENVLLASIVFYLSLVSSWRIDVDAFVNYMSYSPNKYRLTDQLIILLDDYIGMGNLFALVFAISMFVVFQYTSRNIGTIGLAMYAALTFKIRSALVYPMICLVVLTSNSFLMIPMVFVKEYGVILCTFFFFVFKFDNKIRKTFLAGGVSFGIWCLIVVVMGNTIIIGLPTGFGFTSMLWHIQSWSIMTIVIRLTVIVPAILLMLKDRKHVLYVLSCVCILFVVGDFFEAQHWLGIAVVLDAYQKRFSNNC